MSGVFCHTWGLWSHRGTLVLLGDYYCTWGLLTYQWTLVAQGGFCHMRMLLSHQGIFFNHFCQNGGFYHTRQIMDDQGTFVTNGFFFFTLGGCALSLQLGIIGVC